ncbi:O-methyltransferase [Gleimia sp. 6138-11-ORH1]|uniref:O-methyltransferase n=1 Tax=Gleimia sp. 6138-11-ORH1 TaxID=2973937 RepID=UPI00216A876E|nr:O-methyltransferase [Gleimia sp. 6138-11-ORH1]MCS4483965.1 O-methyltransferase [Gleimia sp. 6138-11-ORH1]
MSNDKTLSWSYCEDFVPEGEVLETARQHARDLAVSAISPGVGATLRMLVASCGAKAVAEIGTGTGVSGLWLLSGMSADAVLTTIDKDIENHRIAKTAFAAAGMRPPRTRIITSLALDVLPRMATRAYDLVFIDADVAYYQAYVKEATRMLRRGGILAIAHALWNDTVADPARRETETVLMRQLGKELAESDSFMTSILPVGDGLLVAVRR